MRVLKFGLLVIVFVVVAGGVYLWRLPAQVAWQRLHARAPALALSGIAGTAWNGSADAVNLMGRDLGQIHWQVSRRSLLAGKPLANLRIGGGEFELAGQLERLAPGRYDFTDLHFRAPVEKLARLFVGADLQVEGTLAGTLDSGAIDGIEVLRLAGQARWSEVGVRSARGQLQLSDLLAEFATRPDGTISARFHDDGSGAFTVSGQASLHLPQWQLEARLRARHGDAASAQRLQGIGELQPDGAHLVRLAGTLGAGH